MLSRSALCRAAAYHFNVFKCSHHGIGVRLVSSLNGLHINNLDKRSQGIPFPKTFTYSNNFLKRQSSDIKVSPCNTNDGEDTSSTQPIEDGPHRLDIRVGKVMQVSLHPDADTLYVLKVDVAEAQPRTVISGLVKFVKLEELDQRLVAVLCNLKPSKMRGIFSEGMVLCTSNTEQDVVEPIIVPASATPGSRLVFEGHNGAPDEELKPKKKVWEKLSAHMTTNADGVAMWKDSHLVTSTGDKLTSTLVNCCIK